MPPKKTASTKSAAKTSSSGKAPAKPKPVASKQGKYEEGTSKPEASAVQETKQSKTLPEIEITLKQIASVLVEDANHKIADSQRWPLVIDQADRVSTFLRYQNVNYINALTPSDMNTDVLRRALLGALKFGKPFVYDMMEADVFNALIERFNEILPGLMDMVMDRSIMQEENYKKLIRPHDGKEFEAEGFCVTENFRFIVLSTNVSPSDQLKTTMLIIRVQP